MQGLDVRRYNNVISLLNGEGLTAAQAKTARQAVVRNKFIGIVDAVRQNDTDALRTAYSFVTKQLTEKAVDSILAEIHPDLKSQVATRLGKGFSVVGSTSSSAQDLRHAFDNVRSLTEFSSDAARAAKRTLAEHKLELTTVAYADGHRISGVWGDDIADVQLKAYEPQARRARGEARPTMDTPIIKDRNWTGPFAVIDLEAFSVKTKKGQLVSLKDIIDNPSRYINGWKGPDASFFDADRDTADRRAKTGPKAAVMDTLVPAADGHTDTVPSIYTYNKQKLVLVIVPGEGISAHYTDGTQEITLPIHEKGREKALRITRQQFSAKKGPTSFDRGTNAVDDMLVNSALIVQIPVRDPDARPRPLYRAPVMMAAASLESVSRASADAGRLGTEAGVVSAGGDLGRQKGIPPRLERAGGNIRVDFVLYAATDANVISSALASRMRHDMDSVLSHPSCERIGREN
jgi:hypothetical protein